MNTSEKSSKWILELRVYKPDLFLSIVSYVKNKNKQKPYTAYCFSFAPVCSVPLLNNDDVIQHLLKPSTLLKNLIKLNYLM